MGDAELPDDRKLEVVMDTAELYSCRRRIRAIRARLRSADAGAETDDLFEEATSLQRRAGELSGRLSSSLTS